jgi:hypothetical protein
MADECTEGVYSWPGDPNGNVTAVGPALCQERDANGEVVRVWIKDAGSTGNTGWH